MDWLSSVHNVRALTVGRIAALSETIGELQKSLSGVSTRMGAVVSFQEQSVVRMGSLVDMLKDSALRTAEWDNKINDSEARALVRRIETELAGLAQIKQFFSFVSTVTAIQIARETSSEMTSFVDELKVMPERIGADLELARAGVSSFRQSFDVIASESRAESEFLAQACSRLGQATAPLEHVEAEVIAAAEKTARQAHHSLSTATKTITSLVTAFQFSDSAMQRLEHVEAILASDANSEACLHLATAQLEALAADGDEILNELTAAIVDVEGLGSTVVQSFTENQSQLRALLSAQEIVSPLFQTAIDRIGPSLHKISQRCLTFNSQTEGVLMHLEALSHISDSVHLASVNARVKSSRASVARRELSYISMAVQESAAQTEQAILSAQSDLGQLRARLEDMDVQEMLEQTEKLQSKFQDVHDSFAMANDREAQLSDIAEQMSLQLNEMSKVGVTFRERLLPVSELMTNIRQMSVTMKRQAPPTLKPSDLSQLEVFRPIYTMAREREVHAAVVGENYEEAAVELDMDAILF